MLHTLASVKGTFEERVKSATGLTLRSFEEHFYEKPSSRIVQASIHNRCGQSCNHCFQREQYPEKNTDPKDVLEVFATFGAEYRKYPFPRDILMSLDLLPVYQRVNCTEISTTALPLKRRPELLEELHKHGIQTIFVSLHGNQEDHCSLTNTSSRRYNDLIDSLRLIVDAGFNLEIVTTLYRGNVGALDDLPELLINIGVSSWWIQRIMPSGFARDWPFRDFLYGEACETIMRKYAQLKSHYLPNELHVGLDLTWGPNFYSQNMLKFLAGQLHRWPWTRSVCPAATNESLVISMDSGKIYPCLFFESFPDTEVGEVTSSGRINIRQRRYFAEVLTDNLRGLCKDCEYKRFCLGGCRALAYSFSVQRGERDPGSAGQDFCLTQAIRSELSVTGPHLNLSVADRIA